MNRGRQEAMPLPHTQNTIRYIFTYFSIVKLGNIRREGDECLEYVCSLLIIFKTLCLI